jgi:hypothetical protein
MEFYIILAVIVSIIGYLLFLKVQNKNSKLLKEVVIEPQPIPTTPEPAVQESKVIVSVVEQEVQTPVEVPEAPAKATKTKKTTKSTTTPKPRTKRKSENTQ